MPDYPHVISALVKPYPVRWMAARAVARAFERGIGPLRLAESWDNVNDTLAASLGTPSSVDILGEIKENDAGAGRLVTLSDPVSLNTLCQRVKAYCGLERLQVGVSPKLGSFTDSLIRTIALCAGSGGSVLKGAKTDVYLTGEMSHYSNGFQHEVLAAVAQGTSVILCERLYLSLFHQSHIIMLTGGHSNTERPYLPTLQRKLQEALDQDPEFQGEKYEVVISSADKDPLTIL
ncbi:NGG1 interacting factor [Ceratobasidium sp. 414]|nr:NGG1 interacting factor [Ceratobasidium sp. 414]